jgi:predicted SprT family Zn-dependent metalloprotease
MAYYKKGEIALSSVVLVSQEQVQATLVHEYAHLLAVKRHGMRAGAHGAAWRQAMIDLGAEPKVRHNYEVLRNKPRQQVTYLCVKCGKEFDRTRRLPKRRKYVHASCGGALKLKAIVERKD